MNTTSTIHTPPLDQAAQLNADAALDTLLRQDASLHRDAYIDNDGFSDSIMQRIAQAPAPGGLNLRRRFVVVSVLAAVASALVMFAGPGANFFIDVTMDIATETITPAVIGLAVILAAIGMLAIAAAASEK
jgi:hypothetical protein